MLRDQGEMWKIYGSGAAQKSTGSAKLVKSAGL
jgi:hypothetical protein